MNSSKSGATGREDLKPGIVRERRLMVQGDIVTRHVGGAGVLATPGMIWRMEDACHELAMEFLGPDMTTVGYEVHVKHLKPVDVGEEIVIVARVDEVREHKLLFSVECRYKEDIVGIGSHKRAIVPGRAASS